MLCLGEVRPRRSNNNPIASEVILTSLTSVNCVGGATDCYVVDGKLTLFGSDLETESLATKDTLRRNVNRGDYNNLDGRIIRLTFLNATDLDQFPDDQQPRAPSGATNGNEIPVYGWVLIVVGSILLLAMLCACPNPCARKEFYDDDEEEHYVDHRESLLVHDHEYNDFEMPTGFSRRSFQGDNYDFT